MSEALHLRLKEQVMRNIAGVFRSSSSLAAAGLALCALGVWPGAFVSLAYAEDCVLTLPGADCTLDENTTAPLTIDAGTNLFIGASVSIDHAIDGDDNAGDGDIETSVVAGTITQNAEIGANIAVGSLTIANDTIWNSSAAIITNNDGSDIDLGAGDGGERLNFLDGSSYSAEIDGHAGDIVDFGADGNGGSFTTGGQIESVRVVLTSGTLDVNNVLGGGVGLAALDIRDGASLVMGARVTVDGALDLDGSVRVVSGNTLSADSYVSDADAGALTLEVGRAAGATVLGNLVIGGAPLDLGADIVEVVINPGAQVLVNETVANIIVGNGGGVTVGPGTFVENSYLYDFSLQANGNNFDLVVQRQDLESVAANKNNLSVATVVLESLAASEAPGVNEVQALLGNDVSREAFNERLESLQPTLDGGYIQASMAVADIVEDLVENRMYVARRDWEVWPEEESTKTVVLVSGRRDLKTGQSEISNERKRRKKGKGDVWVAAFTQSGAQDAEDTVDGVDLETAGVTVGADSGGMLNDLFFGGAVTVGGSKLHSDNANSSNTKSETRGVTLYGGRYFENGALLSGAITYLHSDNEIERYRVGGISGNTASATYTSEQISVRSGLYKTFDVADRMKLTPGFSMDFDTIVTDEFVETPGSRGELALGVDYDTVRRLSAGVHVNADWLYRLGEDVRILPTARLSYKYSAMNDAIAAKATLAGQTFEVVGIESEPHVVGAGGGATMEIAEKWLVSADYQMQLKGEYSDHSGKVNLVYEF